MRHAGNEAAFQQVGLFEFADQLDEFVTQHIEIMGGLRFGSASLLMRSLVRYSRRYFT